MRRTPASIATFNQMTGAIEALRDEDHSTRIASSAAGQRLLFTLTGPNGPVANTAIAAEHFKQLTQGGTTGTTNGPTNTAGFLRIGAANFDATAKPAPAAAPRPIYSIWVENPSTADLWTSATLPNEVGIMST